ncbi:NADH-quinone oxidoreductase subunit NuoE [Cellulomonas chengniuliangii]|uniref:NADH-quinone oxidoreductase subunit NuoE n=1 Tax=Cellulomonas chengniuliangii TaxID=2968084 RepID=A0ABY5KWU2_9CELL|nr:NADH-quinone oxidoreductase subunit NuoE [Cellulomonas chengniuliangii]MCC2309561.1 NADH-quinone oxidoreductase subunit NuoE [Cellulomonas chengniuliangii]MCC2316832.1 NADH-quinone oxidoreductase subunit NuoE [Cellulomonas chengniuliangii]UUI74884.1 NADH-quinone oxidoreductase subunit NuoE [Cellulomonas chengniuliangii]
MSVENSERPAGTARPAARYDDATHARLSADAALVIARYPQARSALLPLLHLVQSEDGFVSPAGIAFCAETLDLTAAEVSAVATFYSQYKRRPNGEYTVGVCTNTLCAIMGGDAIWEELSEHLDLGNDETTADGKVTLERIECNAACDYAPVVMVNWEFLDNQTPESAVQTVDKLRAGEPVASTRGPGKICSFKQVSRVLAGFPDGLADEGPSAGPETERGTVLAAAEGWAAPPLPGEGGAEPDTTTPTASASGGSAPEVGAQQSSAQRTPTGANDSSAAAQQKKQTSDQAKES